MVTKAELGVSSRQILLPLLTYLLPPARSWRDLSGEVATVLTTSTSRRACCDMGISFSSLVCGEPEPEEVTVEHGDSVPNSKAIHVAIASGLAAAAGGRNDELQAKRFDPRPGNPRSLKLLNSP